MEFTFSIYHFLLSNKISQILVILIVYLYYTYVYLFLFIESITDLTCNVLVSAPSPRFNIFTIIKRTVFIIIVKTVLLHYPF